MDPKVIHATTRDGVKIAYTKHGSGPPLIFVRGWISHLEVFWSDPDFRAFFTRLGQKFTVYRYDCRGNGLSSRSQIRLNWDTLTYDLEAIVDQEGLQDFTLWGSTFGSLICVHYAARNQDRIGKLILDGVYLDGTELTSWSRRFFLVQALRWSPEMAFLSLANSTNPNSKNLVYRRSEVVHQMIYPRTASKLYSLASNANITRIIRTIETPTLVLHRKDSASVPFRIARQAAELLPNSYLQELGGTAHNLWEEDPLTSFDYIVHFAGRSAGEVSDDAEGNDAFAGLSDVAERSSTSFPDRRIAVVFFADIHNYTRGMDSDDTEYHRIAVSEIALLRSYIESFDGRTYQVTGDAVLAEFGSAYAAVCCALDFQNRAAKVPGARPNRSVNFRIGINIGDVFDVGDSINGTAVIIAQRLESLCNPGGVCTSGGTYRAVTSAIEARFDVERGVALKNIDEPMDVYRIN